MLQNLKIIISQTNAEIGRFRKYESVTREWLVTALAGVKDKPRPFIESMWKNLISF